MKGSGSVPTKGKSGVSKGSKSSTSSTVTNGTSGMIGVGGVDTTNTTNNNNNNNNKNTTMIGKVTPKDTTKPISVPSSNKTSSTDISVKKAPSVLPSSSEDDNLLINIVWLSLLGYALYRIVIAAYTIRLGAIEEYGPVIHEFDPYFNYRATEYLFWNGAQRFFRWFDHKVWYPLGRPVGTTIYPGMQFTAVYMKRYLLSGTFWGYSMSLNDTCCYIPAWFGVIASIVTGMIAYECTIPNNTSSNLVQFVYQLFLLLVTGKRNCSVGTTTSSSSFFGLVSPAAECAIVAMAMMSIVPAHLMRSMGGGFDNESVAVTAMVLTFYFWVRSLRHNDPNAYWFGIATGLSYFYMVASWGGYVFVLNLIGAHAGVLVVLGRFDVKTVYRSYTLFYVIGTTLAMQIPVVGYAPIKSLEQLGPASVFILYQLLYVTETIIAYKTFNTKQQTSNVGGHEGWTRKQCYVFRIQVLGVSAVLGLLMVMILAPTGYFGPLSSRIRGLFVKHTKTGNPLVDSVAEHQPASGRAYFQYLHHVCSLAPLGYIIVMFQLSNSSSFLLVWGTAAYFFSHKMVRLILLTAPIGSILGGIAAGRILVWSVEQWWDGSTVSTNKHRKQKPFAIIQSTSNASVDTNDDEFPATNISTADSGDGITATRSKGKKSKKSSSLTTGVQPYSGSSKSRSNSSNRTTDGSSFDGLISLHEAIYTFSITREGYMARRFMAASFLVCFFIGASSFVTYCWRLRQDLSNPSIIVKARRRDNVVVKIDDYREAYWWLRDNTPEDSRIMAWWDYGYQISAIANRTTLADGNTWNHEHIALLGKALTTDLDEGWEIARHLADYVLVWGGGGGDDLAKSPHLARIATSVYRDHCPDDPTCRAFGFIDRQLTPSAMMRRSLLYRLHGYQLKPDIDVPEDKFVEVYRSMYGRVRIYQVIGVSIESKDWVADPRNRLCDAPGSWFCPGQYPPGLQDILSRKMDFRQLEDFNRGGGNTEYQEQYFRDLQNPEGARRKMLEKEHKERMLEKKRDMSDEQKRREIMKRDEIYRAWGDTDDTTKMWRLISSNDIEGLKEWLEVEPNKAFIRSKDGRGPMWWAFEKRNEEITKLLMTAGVPHTDVDAKGLSPLDLLQNKKA